MREREVIRTKYSTTRNLREIIAWNIYRYIFEVLVKLYLTISSFFNFIKFSFVTNQSKLFPTKNWMCNPIVDCEDNKNKKINWSIYPYFFEYILFVFVTLRIRHRLNFHVYLFIRIREVAEYGKLFSSLNQGNRRGIRLLDCHYNELTRVREK